MKLRYLVLLAAWALIFSLAPFVYAHRKTVDPVGMLLYFAVVGIVGILTVVSVVYFVEKD